MDPSPDVLVELFDNASLKDHSAEPALGLPLDFPHLFHYFDDYFPDYHHCVQKQSLKESRIPRVQLGENHQPQHRSPLHVWGSGARGLRGSCLNGSRLTVAEPLRPDLTSWTPLELQKQRRHQQQLDRRQSQSHSHSAAASAVAAAPPNLVVFPPTNAETSSQLVANHAQPSHPILHFDHPPADSRSQLHELRLPSCQRIAARENVLLAWTLKSPPVVASSSHHLHHQNKSINNLRPRAPSHHASPESQPRSVATHRSHRESQPARTPIVDAIMASADGGGPATATRSRRRQRPKSSESLTQQPKAKRQRLPLTEQTFVNPDAPPEMAQVKDEKVATLNSRKNGSDTENHDRHQQYLQPQPQPSVRRESMGRIKKPKHSDRAANKGDGSLLLVRDTYYEPQSLDNWQLTFNRRRAPVRIASAGCQLFRIRFEPTGHVRVPLILPLLRS